jgi:hypothetical protein
LFVPFFACCTDFLSHDVFGGDAMETPDVYNHGAGW